MRNEERKGKREKGTEKKEKGREQALKLGRNFLSGNFLDKSENLCDIIGRR